MIVVVFVNNATTYKQHEPPLLGIPVCDVIAMNLNQSESIFIYIFCFHHNL